MEDAFSGDWQKVSLVWWRRRIFLLAALIHQGKGRRNEGQLSGTGKEPVSD